VPAEQPVAAADIEKMVAGLAAKLEKNPDDARGWVMLARSYYVLQRMPEAAAAYAKAAEKISDDADLLVDYADALAMAQGKRIDGKPLELVHQALKINPSHPKALAMAGTAAFFRNDYPGAIAFWEKLLPLLPPDSEMAKSVVGGIAEARELGGKTAHATSTPAKTSVKTESKSIEALSVSGKVTLSPAMANKANPEDTLFIVARAANGPRMPLAVVRRRVADLPLEFKLDDALAMSPELKLSAFPEVIVTARISKSGNALSQPGDLQGVTRPVKVGAKGIAIVIDSVVP
jgi:cytochrome c-type biogenesis protein CcmH